MSRLLRRGSSWLVSSGRVNSSACWSAMFLKQYRTARRTLSLTQNIIRLKFYCSVCLFGKSGTAIRNPPRQAIEHWASKLEESNHLFQRFMVEDAAVRAGVTPCFCETLVCPRLWDTYDKSLQCQCFVTDRDNAVITCFLSRRSLGEPKTL